MIFTFRLLYIFYFVEYTNSSNTHQFNLSDKNRFTVVGTAIPPEANNWHVYLSTESMSCHLPIGLAEKVWKEYRLWWKEEICLYYRRTSFLPIFRTWNHSKHTITPLFSYHHFIFQTLLNSNYCLINRLFKFFMKKIFLRPSPIWSSPPNKTKEKYLQGEKYLKYLHKIWKTSRVHKSENFYPQMTSSHFSSLKD